MIFTLSAMELDTWADRLEARHLLPRFIRQLILSQSGVERLEFPSDESIQRPGYDGILSFSGDSPYIPQGRSVWECGVSSDPRDKAQKDYKKRTEAGKSTSTNQNEDPEVEETQGVTASAPNIDLSEHTFVAVTLREWKDKEAWVEKKRKENHWKDVRAYDANDLAAWLECHPTVLSWLLAVVGKLPPEYLHLEKFWEDYAEATHPTTRPGLLLAGRELQKALLLDGLQGPNQLISLQAENREAALAFVAATVLSSPDDVRDRLLSRCMVITHPSVFHTVAQQPSPLILLACFENTQGLAAAAKNHTVVALSGANQHTPAGTITLPRSDLIDLYEALQDMQVPANQMRALASLGRNNLLALRRRLSRSPEIQQPHWVAARGGLPLPALLAAGWDDEHEGDQKILEELCSLGYAVLQEQVTEAAHGEDPLFRRSKHFWLVSAPADVWEHLGGRFTPHHLRTFERVASKTLVAVGQVLSQGSVSEHDAPLLPSGLLFRRMLDTLVLMSAYQDDARTNHLGLGGTVHRIVAALLEVNSSWETWQGWSAHLNQFAEAAPEPLLSAAEHRLMKDEGIQALFESRQLGWSESTLFVQLVRALGIVAWTPRLFSRVIRLLVRLHTLAQQQPESAGTAKTLLHSLLNGVFPATTLRGPVLLDALDVVRHLRPDLGWELACDLLPKHWIVLETPITPKWNPLVPAQDPQVTRREVQAFAEGLVQRLFQDAKSGPEKVLFLLENVLYLSEAHRDRLLELMNGMPLRSLPVHLKQKMMEQFRQLERKQNFEDQVVFTEAQMAKAAMVQCKLIPEDLVDAHAWMFSPAPAFPGVDRRDYKSYSATIQQMQEKALTWLMGQIGLRGLSRLWHITQQSHMISEFLVDRLVCLTPDQENAFLYGFLNHADWFMDYLAQRLVLRRMEGGNPAWQKEKLTALLPLLNEKQQQKFLLLFPPSAEVWDAAEVLGDQVSKAYWDQMRPLQLQGEDEERVIRKLLDSKRVRSAVRVMQQRNKTSGVTLEAVMDLLELASESEWVEEPELDIQFEWELSAVFQDLVKDQALDLRRKRLLEMRYFRCFPDHVQSPGLAHEWMTEDPEVYFQVLMQVYPAEDGKHNPQSVPANAKRLLETWHGVPGLGKRDLFDPDVFLAWFQSAYKMALEHQCEEAFMCQMVALFRRVPEGADGSWPHPVVRDLIEGWPRPELDGLLLEGFLRDHGLYAKSMTDGGSLEQSRAEKYQRHADVASIRHPRTEKVLRDMVLFYQQNAHLLDLQASMQQDLDVW